MKIRQTKDGIEIETKEIDFSEIIHKLNERVSSFYSLYGHEPKVIIVPNYIEYFMQNYCTNTCTGIYNKTYSTFMNILVVGTERKTKIDEIEVF